MPYTSEKPDNAPAPEQLKMQIPGWGADLDPALRPGVPKEPFNPAASGAHWHFPERQVAAWPREKSTEHKMLTPAFGTSCPPKGLSGVIRKLAYAKYSEGQSAHWLLLMLGDRIDILEGILSDIAHGRLPNLLQEYGLKAEWTRHGFKSRIGRGRADVRRWPYEALLLGGIAALGVTGVMLLRRRTA